MLIWLKTYRLTERFSAPIFQFVACRTSHPNAMDPRVEKLLEGKSDVVKSQAIVFAIACSSTRPTRNSSPEPSSFLGKPRRNRTPVKEPKFSFEESSDDEELSE
ncbi:uncharacterized protein [Montipora capricornis]|uniref:uncharacterized protein isoform X2 n=1 Tax=Montipora foliosa TaxID=591990 RepID=UPI0035F1C057